MGKACTKPLRPFDPTSPPATAARDTRVRDAGGGDFGEDNSEIAATRELAPDSAPEGPKSGARGLALRLHQLGSKNKQVSDLLALSTCQDDPKRDFRPPHMIRDGKPRLGNGFRFYVCVYGLHLKYHVSVPPLGLPITKRRSLPTRSSLPHESGVANVVQNFVVLSWDDGWYVRRTDLVTPSGLTTLFNSCFLFYWYCDELNSLSSKIATLSVFALHGARQLVRLGDVKVNLFTIATGPVHHDLPLVNDVDSSERPSLDKKHNRLQFNVRMSQICEMLITPVEMLVHVLNNPVTSNEPSEVLSCVPQTSFHHPPAEAPPVRSKSVNELGRSVKTLDSEEETLTAETPSIQNSEEAEIEKAAAGGHSNEDGRCPILAKWRLDFSPTGVTNPTVFPSAWTDLTSKPYWNSLKLQSPAAPVSSLHQSLTMLDSGRPNADVVNETLEDSNVEVRRTMSHGVSFVPLRPSLALSPSLATDENDNPSSTGLKDKLALRPVSSWQIDSNATDSRTGSYARQISSSAARGLRLSVVARHELGPTHPASKNPFVQTERIENTCWKPPADAKSRQQSGLFADLNLLESSAQAVYRTIAMRCRNGNVVTEYVDSKVFPSCHLMTTGDTLRQFHLHLRVWNQPLGVGKPRLFGETWVPFFKLYESDIVDIGEKHFYDAHFCETLWNEGRSVAKLEGLLVFQDSPLIRQMLAGVHTERGFNRIAMPVLGELTSSESAKRSIPKEVLLLCQLQADLASNLFASSNISGVKQASGTDAKNATMDIKKTCETILELLTKPSVSSPNDPLNFRSAFVYDNLASLLCGQRVLLDLAVHVLDVEDLVPWHVRGLYGQILSALLKRAELDMGNLIPRIPEFCKRYPNLDVKELTKIARKLDRMSSRDKVYIKDEDPRSPISAKSAIRRLHVFAKFKYNGIPSVRRRPLPESSPKIDEGLIHTSNTMASAVSNSSSRSTETRAAADDTLLSPTDSNDDRKDDSSFSDVPERTALKSQTEFQTPRALQSMASSPVEKTLQSEEVSDLLMYHKRMKLSKMYLMVLLRLRKYGLSKVCSEALFESQRRLLCSHLAILLIRLPSFREELLAKVLTQEERVAIVPGWRGQEFALDKESLDAHDKWVSKTFPGLYEIQVAFDWDPFHATIREYFGNEISQQLDESINSGRVGEDSSSDLADWAERILRPRGIVFFTLLEAWIRIIWQTIQWQRRYPSLGIEVERNSYSRTNNSVPNIRWDLIPGYATLLKAFLIEIRTRPIAKFPDALLNCSAALLVNDRLLSVFMRMVLTRTSVFSREQVFAVLNYIDFWLEVLSVKNWPLPLTFDCRFLGRALETVVTSDLALQTAKGLWFVYKRMELLNSSKMLQILLDMLVYRRFNDLIMHWSWLVRKCFVSLLLYRLSEAARRIVARHSDSKNVQRVTTTLSDTDRMVLWAFVLMSRSLTTLGLLEVFPSRFLNVNLRQILSQPDSKSESTDFSSNVSQPLIWNVPRVLPTVQCLPPSQPPESQPSPTHGLSRVQSQAVLADAQLAADPLSPSTIGTHHAAFQRPVRVYRQGLKRIRRRRSHRDDSEVESKPTEMPGNKVASFNGIATEQPDDPHQYLPAPMDIQTRQRPYIKCLVKEFAIELEAYKVWVISGTTEVPPMHIPASPLDTNVDVPLEDE